MSSRLRLWFIVSSLVVVIIALVPPAVSKTDDKERKGDDDPGAQVGKVAALCARECHDLCAVLPKTEDPFCDRRCASISSVFNGSVVEPAAPTQTTSTAMQEIQMC